jgi:hypothetical protein
MGSVIDLMLRMRAMLHRSARRRLRCANVLRQNLAAALETALDDLRAKGINVGNFLVVLDYGSVCSGVNRRHVDARHSLQLVLDPSMVENREHAADFEDRRSHLLVPLNGDRIEA